MTSTVLPNTLDPLDLASRVRGGQRLLGALVRMPNELIAELSGMVGLDYLIIDAEHGPVDQIALAHHIHAAESVGIPTLVRVGALGEILRALDLGAAGIVYPHVDSVEQAQELVETVHYPPRGRRGFAAYTRAGGYGLHTNAIHHAHYAPGPLIVAMIESREGLAAAADIAAVDGIDLLFPGPSDLAVEMGLVGQDLSPVDRALADVRTAAKGRVLNICGDPTAARRFFDSGSQLVVYNIQHALSAMMLELAAATPGVGVG